jgi:tetratricopeptide (TPR) repeat protein
MMAIMYELAQTSLAGSRTLDYGLSLTALAQLYLEEGAPSEADALADEALAYIEVVGHANYLANVYRVKGECLGHVDQPAAEAMFHQAIAVAQEQGSKMLELRSAVSLCCLLREQGRIEEARQRLAEIYCWFTEGEASSELQEALALLGALAPP